MNPRQMLLPLSTFLWAALLSAAVPSHAQTETLTVYTYSSFASEWGPGPLIEPAYEAHCGCDLKFVAVEDGAALLGALETGRRANLR